MTITSGKRSWQSKWTMAWADKWIRFIITKHVISLYIGTYSYPSNNDISSSLNIKSSWNILKYQNVFHIKIYILVGITICDIYYYHLLNMHYLFASFMNAIGPQMQHKRRPMTLLSSIAISSIFPPTFLRDSSNESGSIFFMSGKEILPNHRVWPKNIIYAIIYEKWENFASVTLHKSKFQLVLGIIPRSLVCNGVRFLSLASSFSWDSILCTWIRTDCFEGLTSCPWQMESSCLY